MSRIQDQLADDIIDFIQKHNDHPAIDNLDYHLEGGRDYNTNVFNTIVKAAVEMIEFFDDDYRRGESEDDNYWDVIELIVWYNAAKEGRKSSRVMNNLTDREEDDLMSYMDEMDDVLKEYRAWIRGAGRNNHERRSNRVHARSGSGDSRRNRRDDDRGSRRDNNERRTPRRRRDDSESNNGTNTRCSRIAEKREERENERAEKNVRAPRSNREWRKEETQAPKVTYFSTPWEARSYPRRDLTEIPYVNHDTQLLFLTFDNEGFVNWIVKEKSEVHPEDHKHAISMYIYESRRNQYVAERDRKVNYVSDSIEIDADMVENELVQEALEKRRELGIIKKEDTFMTLNDGMKSEILVEVADKKLSNRAKQESIRNAELIKQGKDADPLGNISMISIHEDKARYRTPKQAVNVIMARVGDELASNNNRNTGYYMRYRDANILYKFENEETRDITRNLMTALMDTTTSTDINKILNTLKQNLPIDVFTRFNTKGNHVATMGLHYILGFTNIRVNDFTDDLPDLSEFLMSEMAKGSTDTAAVNEFNKYVSTQLANVVEPTKEMIKSTDSTVNDVLLETLVRQSLYTLDEGLITYVPMMSMELGLSTEGRNIIPRDNSKFISSLIKPNASPLDYLYTSDGCYFRVVHSNGERIVLEYIRM